MPGLKHLAEQIKSLFSMRISISEKIYDYSDKTGIFEVMGNDDPIVDFLEINY